IKANDSRNYEMITLNINDWDMNTDVFKNVAHGISDISKIRSVSILIRNDAGTNIYRLDYKENSATAHAGTYSITITNISMMRAISPDGFFDSTDFDSIGYNRGWIHITYEV